MRSSHDSTTAPRHTVIVGARGALGSALVRATRAGTPDGLVFALSHREAVPDDGPASGPVDGILRQHADATDPASMQAAADLVARHAARIHRLIICTGVLHGGPDDPSLTPEKSLDALHHAALQRAITLNAHAPLLALQAFAPLLCHPEGAIAAALSAKVGSIGDNRLGGWYSYRMSKAALNMGLRCAAIELGRRRHGPIVVAIHPGTTASPLSAPFASAARARTPDESAAAILNVLERLEPADSGQFFNWDGTRLPW